MSNSFGVLWLNVSPSLKYFDQPLLRYLAGQIKIARSEYYQTLDEASSLEKAVTLLYDYIKERDRPVHLIGHGMGGVLGLIYARRYPKHIQSLALLAVASQSAATWHAHYYVQRQLLSCSRQQVLAQTVRSLFGSQLPFPAKDLVRALARDLEKSLSPHSLFKLVNLPTGGVSMPLMVCGCKTDPVVDPSSLAGWLPLLKQEDYLWECPEGRHFFHFFHPQQVADQVLDFWQSTNLFAPNLLTFGHDNSWTAS